MKYIKNIVILFILSLFITIPVNALDTSLKIYDEADLLTSEEEVTLKKLVDTFILKYKMDLIIVTTEDNSGSTKSYAEDFYDNNNFGVGTTKDGILFLIDRTYGENDTYFLTTGEAIRVYDDNRIDSVFDDVAYEKNNGYYAMFEQFIKSSSNYAEDGVADSNKNTYIDKDGNLKYYVDSNKKYSKIYDDAGLLTSSEKEQLNKLAEEYVKKYKMDLIIVTTLNNSSSGSTKRYAEDFYDNNNFGVGTTKDGILFLIDRTYGENDTYFLTTGEAIRVYDDNRIDLVFDDVTYVKNNGYYAMFEQFIKSSSNYAEDGVADSNKNTYIDKDGNLKEKRMFPIFPFILFSLVTSSIIVAIFIFKNKMVKKATRAMEYLNQKTINYTRKEDRFINTHTTRTHIPRDNGGSGGRIGGSSTSSGSSGRSHGGGGRRM